MLFSERALDNLRTATFAGLRCCCAYFRKLEGAHSRKVIIGVLKPYKEILFIHFHSCFGIGSNKLSYIQETFLAHISSHLRWNRMVCRIRRDSTKL